MRKAAAVMVGVDLSQLSKGQPLVICAKDDYFAFVDGWRGRFAGINNGLAVVQCQRADGVKTFFVPADQLALTVAA